ncbi:UNVERIFIED_CONTAM: hypothetical protein Sangu_3108100 [Sesamum angustifolium]|uniref:SWIM-type domain-containing protein n=1 Tax=Sesamum angustifolium TaxID=2727405 RepID=A0AAW2K6J3_9LAMI
MNDMRTRNTAAYEWLMQRPATHWSKSHFSTTTYSDEEGPYEEDQMMKHTGDLCPKIAKILEDMKKKSMESIAHLNGKDESAYGTRFRLHLGDKTCSCRRWDLTGIPCPHAICGMYYMGHIPEEYVHECYKKETFINTYSQLMGTLNDMDMWPKVDFPPLIPPKCEKPTREA